MSEVLTKELHVRAGDILKARYKRAGRVGHDIVCKVLTPVETPSGSIGIVVTVTGGELMGLGKFTLFLTEAFGPKSQVVGHENPDPIPDNLMMATRFSRSWNPCELAAPADLAEWGDSGVIVTVASRATEEDAIITIEA